MLKKSMLADGQSKSISIRTSRSHIHTCTLVCSLPEDNGRGTIDNLNRTTAPSPTWMPNQGALPLWGTHMHELPDTVFSRLPISCHFLCILEYLVPWGEALKAGILFFTSFFFLFFFLKVLRESFTAEKSHHGLIPQIDSGACSSSLRESLVISFKELISFS